MPEHYASPCPTRQTLDRPDNGYAYNVDSGRLNLPQCGWAPDSSKHPATRAPYMREPYVRAQLDDGTVVDAKAFTWTDQHVQLKWVDDDLETRTLWVPATAVTRISREESSWQDPYDR